VNVDSITGHVVFSSLANLVRVRPRTLCLACDGQTLESGALLSKDAAYPLEISCFRPNHRRSDWNIKCSLCVPGPTKPAFGCLEDATPQYYYTVDSTGANGTSDGVKNTIKHFTTR